MASDSRALEELRIDKQAKQQGGAPWILWGVLALAIAGAAAYWFLLRVPAAIQVTLATVEELRSEPAGGTVLNASGYVTARRRATVSSKVTGRVVEVLVEEGKSVRKGQVLARLDAASAERYLALSNAELEAARRGAAEYAVRLDQARLTRHRTEQLRADGIVNQADVDAARTEVGALEARLALANEQVRVAERQVAVRQNDLSEMVILAPFDGVAISKDAQPGEMISPVSAGGGFTRTGICTLVDMSSLEIEVDVNESYIHRVTPGQRVEAVLDAYPDWRVPAAVITTVPAADRQKATVLVRIAFDALDPRILPDMGVKVAFLEAARPAAAGAGAQKPKLTIPKEALRTDGDSRIVFVAGSEGRAERRAVRAGRANGERVEIDSGLAPGEKVVVSASRQLSAGARITEAK